MKFNKIEAVCLLNHNHLQKTRINNYINSVADKITLVEINDESDDLSNPNNLNTEDFIIPINTNLENYSIGEFDNTAMGGSFDHVHVGHKVSYSLKKGNANYSSLNLKR